MSTLKHYRLRRESDRLLPFWSNRGLCEQSQTNYSELLTRADILIDGLEMLLPAETSAQKRLQREAIQDAQRTMMLALGAFQLEDERR